MCTHSRDTTDASWTSIISPFPCQPHSSFPQGVEARLTQAGLTEKSTETHGGLVIDVDEPRSLLSESALL